MTSPSAAFDMASSTPDQKGWELMRLLNNKDQYDETYALALIKAGANIEVETEHEDRPLLIAAFQGYGAVVKGLIAAKAQVDARDFIGHSAVMFAASGGFTEIFDDLVAAKAKIDFRNDFQEDAYFMAAENGKEDIVDRLIKMGVPLEILNRVPNGKGKTPRDIAEEKGHIAVVQRIDRAIFERDEPARQEQERRQYILLHVGDSFRDGLKTATLAPETAKFRPKSKPAL